MKKLILLSAIIVVLSGCNISTSNTTEKTENTNTQNINSNDVISTRIDTTSGVGEICGGIELMKCHQGLSCVFDYDSADGSGLCAEKVVNEKECDESYFPVCGINDGRQKYTYFNKCQMERHGAEFVNDGKCEVDENVAGNCEAIASGFSNCFETTTSYEFDGDSCVKKVVAGCEVEIPFETLEACEASCS